MSAIPPRSGFWIRLLAALIDAVLFFPLLLLVTTVVYAFLSDRVSDETVVVRWTNAILMLAWLLYSSTEFVARGTPGKMILRLKIVAVDGSPADPWRRVLRWSTKQSPAILTLFFALTAFPPFYFVAGLASLFVLIGCLFASNDDKLAWHDQWAKTAVERRVRITPGGFPVEPGPVQT